MAKNLTAADKLNILLWVMKDITNNLSKEGLLESFKQILYENLNLHKLLLFVKHGSTWSIEIKSYDFDYHGINVSEDLCEIKSIAFIDSEDTPFKDFDFIIPIIKEDEPIAYVVVGDSGGEEEGIASSIRNLHFVQTLTMIIVSTIENRRMQEMKKEMEYASRIQTFLFPEKNILKNDKRLSLSAFYLSHYQVGGDFYDYAYINHDSKDEIYFCIADVTGKGISAAMVMSNFQASLQALIGRIEYLPDLIRELNRIVIKNSNYEKFITVFLARYNFSTHELRYVNAGHNPPVMYNFKTKEKQFLTVGGQGVGMIDDPALKEGILTLGSDTRILCYTDGVCEIEKDGEEYYGQRVIENRAVMEGDVSDAVSLIISDLNINRDNDSLADDATLLGIDLYVR